MPEALWESFLPSCFPFFSRPLYFYLSCISFIYLFIQYSNKKVSHRVIIIMSDGTQKAHFTYIFNENFLATVRSLCSQQFLWLIFDLLPVFPGNSCSSWLFLASDRCATFSQLCFATPLSLKALRPLVLFLWNQRTKARIRISSFSSIPPDRVSNQ